jgi:hypothetical protein
MKPSDPAFCIFNSLALSCPFNPGMIPCSSYSFLLVITSSVSASFAYLTSHSFVLQKSSKPRCVSLAATDSYPDFYIHPYLCLTKLSLALLYCL